MFSIEFLKCVLLLLLLIEGGCTRIFSEPKLKTWMETVEQHVISQVSETSKTREASDIKKWSKEYALEQFQFSLDEYAGVDIFDGRKKSISFNELSFQERNREILLTATVKDLHFTGSVYLFGENIAFVSCDLGCDGVLKKGDVLSIEGWEVIEITNEKIVFKRIIYTSSGAMKTSYKELYIEVSH